jgi:hypothetical protein
MVAQGRETNEIGQIELNLPAVSDLPRFHRFRSPFAPLPFNFYGILGNLTPPFPEKRMREPVSLV